ncbi:hypothetical protein C8Q78DRAFT_1082481 [Trametes maxima]|nr:hypothetical protein C8Q78DRAFT_1082481 [Trametes maxima]
MPVVSSSTQSSPAPVLGTPSTMTEDVTGIPRTLAPGSRDANGGTDAEHPLGATLADDLYSVTHSPAVHDPLHESSQTISGPAHPGNPPFLQSPVKEVPEGETPPVADRDDTVIPQGPVPTDVGLASNSPYLPRHTLDGGDTSLPHAQDAHPPSDANDTHSAYAYSETEGGADSEPTLTPRNNAMDPRPHALMDNKDRRARNVDPEQDASPLTSAPPAETSESIIVRTRSHAAAASNISPSTSPPSAVLDPARERDVPPGAGGNDTGDLDALGPATGGTNAQRPSVPTPLGALPDRAPDAETPPSKDPPAHGAHLSPGATGGSIVGFAGDLVEESTHADGGL